MRLVTAHELQPSLIPAFFMHYIGMLVQLLDIDKQLSGKPHSHQHAAKCVETGGVFVKNLSLSLY